MLLKIRYENMSESVHQLIWQPFGGKIERTWFRVQKICVQNSGLPHINSMSLEN